MDLSGGVSMNSQRLNKYVFTNQTMKLQNQSKCLSVIVPVYNVCQYLERCLNSLCAQSYRNLDIVLVDDGSTDGSGELCNKYANKYSYIKVVHILNAGVSNARNIGLSQIHGEYVTFVDADDWLAEDFLETGMDVLADTSADIFMSGFTKSYEDGINIKFGKNTDRAMVLGSQECIDKIFVVKRKQKNQGLFWGVWGKIYKTSLWENVRFDTNLTMGEDAIAFWDVLKNINNLIYKPVTGYFYFQRMDSATHTMSVKNILDYLKMYQYFYEKSRNMDKKWLKDYFKYRYDMERVNTVYQLACRDAIPKEFYEYKENILRNFGKYLYAAWVIRGIKGIVKTALSVTPVLQFIDKLKAALSTRGGA